MSEKCYCTQNEGDCKTCSRVNYGKDCKNNPIDQQMQEFKIEGIEAVPKTVTSGNGHSARINVPPSWQGKRVMVVRLE
jgi:putative transposon-encoded protein